MAPGGPRGGGNNSPFLNPCPDPGDLHPIDRKLPQTVFQPSTPSQAEPGRAGQSRAEGSRAEPGRADPSRTEPSRARSSPNQTQPSRAEPSRAGLRQAKPGRSRARKHISPWPGGLRLGGFCGVGVGVVGCSVRLLTKRLVSEKLAGAGKFPGAPRHVETTWRGELIHLFSIPAPPLPTYIASTEYGHKLHSSPAHGAKPIRARPG